MCGIAGIFNLNGEPVDASVLQLMTDAIEHRGPDGEGQWIENNVGFGHRRLSIIDLSDNGKQPMHSSTGRFVITYNGEVYNFKEIRNELQLLGIQFKSDSDTEVVVNAIEYWGIQAITRFNGMFAFAVWDKKDRCLTLCRDRYGIKPLYVSENGNRISFGSEQKAILAQPGFHKLIDHEALYEYLTFQNIFTNKTLLKGITIIPAGHFVQIRMDRVKSEQLKTIKYWDYNFKCTTQKIDEREYQEELRRLFTQAVQRQLVSDVPLGSYLSGGMDSGSITAIAAKSIENLNSFTCGFDLSSASGMELAFDERTKAEAMSARFKTEHYEMVLKAGDMERCLPTLAFHLEEPRVGQSYPNYYAAKLASKFVKVVMSGAGGDELFGGYPWRYYRAAKNVDFDDYINKYYDFWQRLTNKEERLLLFSPIKNEVKDIDPKEIFRSVFPEHLSQLSSPEEYINLSLYFEAKTFLHGLFVVEDKLSMAHSLETRVPFMDNDLVDFAMQCPVNLKINNLSEVIRIDENEVGNKVDKFFRRTSDGKMILRNMMRQLVPADIIEAPKQGFSSPDASWFKGESIDFVRKKIHNKNSKMYDYLDYDNTIQIVSQHLKGASNRRLFIWSLLNLETWIEQSL